MSGSISVATLSLVGTCVGSIAGIIASNKLTDFRLRKLEDKVDRHNHLVERMCKVEDRAMSNTHRIDSLERNRG